jgi:hypothetical protein
MANDNPAKFVSAPGTANATAMRRRAVAARQVAMAMNGAGIAAPGPESRAIIE